jgi:anti-anti-sigma factor
VADIAVKAEGNGRYVLCCPAEMAWDARVDLAEAFRSATDGTPVTSVICDLDEVSYINSAGLGAIFALRKRAAELGAKLVVARPSATISRILNTANVGALIPIAETLDEARAILDQTCADEGDD